jgi:hypothetical protein
MAIAVPIVMPLVIVIVVMLPLSMIVTRSIFGRSNEIDRPAFRPKRETESDRPPTGRPKAGERYASDGGATQPPKNEEMKPFEPT